MKGVTPLWRYWPLPSTPSAQAYHELRALARALALATLFDKPEARSHTCDLLQLGLELEKITDIASEPMLAMIRMQWWADLFSHTQAPHEAPDFAKRLYANPAIANHDMLAVIQATQDSLQLPQAATSWDKLFCLISVANGWQIEESVLLRLGQNFGALYQEDSARIYQPLSDKAIKQASGGSYGFMRLVNYLTARQMAGKSQDDHLLVLRYLFRLLV